MTLECDHPPRLISRPAQVLVLGELKGVIPATMSFRLPSPSTGSIVVCLEEEPLTTERAIKEIKAFSGLPWDRIAGIFARQVRTVHLWAEGQGTDSDTEEFIRKVHALLGRAARISPLANRHFLLTVVQGGETVLELLRNKDFKKVEQFLDRHLVSARLMPTPMIEPRIPVASHPSPTVLMTTNPGIGSSITERVVRSKAKRISGV